MCYIHKQGRWCNATGLFNIPAMVKFISKKNKQLPVFVDKVVNAHINEYGIRPRVGRDIDVEETDTMKLIGRLCLSDNRKIASLRKELIHSVRNPSLLQSPWEINDLV